MVKVYGVLEDVRNKIEVLQKEITVNPFFDVPSDIQEKKNKNGYYLHATDDILEVRFIFFELIKTINCSFECIFA